MARLVRVASLVDLSTSSLIDTDLTAAENDLYRLKEQVFEGISRQTSGRTRRWEAAFRELAAALKVRVD